MGGAFKQIESLTPALTVPGSVTLIIKLSSLIQLFASVKVYVKTKLPVVIGVKPPIPVTPVPDQIPFAGENPIN